MRVFKESINFFWTAQTSQIYRDLDNLEKKGFVKSRMVVQDKKPNKKIYEITKEGKEEFIKWINKSAIKEMSTIRDGFLMKIFFGATADFKKLKETIETYKAFNEEEYKRLQQVNEELGKFERLVNDKKESIFWKLTIDKGLLSIKGNIEWANHALKTIEEISREE
jgi:DNA-binding PadR family transcriptional regulator